MTVLGQATEPGSRSPLTTSRLDNVKEISKP
jgi:hypothetical protein